MADYITMADKSNLDQKCDFDEIVKNQGKFSKFVYGCQANAELLPFSSNTFDAYLANLTVHLVHNPKNLILEAQRVLEPEKRTWWYSLLYHLV